MLILSIVIAVFFLVIIIWGLSFNPCLRVNVKNQAELKRFNKLMDRADYCILIGLLGFFTSLFVLFYLYIGA